MKNLEIVLVVSAATILVLATTSIAYANIFGLGSSPTFGMMPLFQSNNGKQGFMGGGMMDGMMGGGMMGSMGITSGSEENWNMPCIPNYGGEDGLYQPNRNQVIISNYQFIPYNLTVEAGTTITWINMDFVGHNIESGTHEHQEGAGTNEEFESPMLGHMQSFSYTFSEPGEYFYHCDPHPYMEGRIIVI